MGTSPEELTFHANEADLVVFLPWNVVTGANVDLTIGQSDPRHRLDRFGLGFLLGCQSVAVEHVQKISVSAGVELISAFQFDAAFLEQIHQGTMGNRGAQLRLDVIPDDRQPG